MEITFKRDQALRLTSHDAKFDTSYHAERQVESNTESAGEDRKGEAKNWGYGAMYRRGASVSLIEQVKIDRSFSGRLNRRCPRLRPTRESQALARRQARCHP
jgi:hypothetical protein